MENVKKLIQRAQEGNEEAFGQIYKMYYGKLYRYIKFNVNHDELAKDICQESFVKAFKSLKSFSTDGQTWSIQAFLFKIARNLIIDNSRKRKEFALEDYENLESDEDLFDKVEKQENIEKVHKALSKLSDIEKQIILLRYFEEMDTKDVAEIIGINDGALRVRVHRTLEKLKLILENDYGKRN